MSSYVIERIAEATRPSLPAQRPAAPEAARFAHVVALARGPADLYIYPMRPFRHMSISALAVLVSTGMLLTAATPAVGADTSRIDAALAAVEASAAAASSAALGADAAAQSARTAADDAQARAGALGRQMVDAEAESAAHRTRLAATATTLSRTVSNGPLVAQLLTSADPESLLSRLGTAERTGRLSAQLVRSAQARSDTVASQRGQAAVAQGERERLATEAEDAAARARAAAESEAVAVDAARRELDALYAELAAAQRTSVARAKAAHVERAVAEQSIEPARGTAPAPAAPPPLATPPPPPAPVPQPVPSAPAAETIATPAQAQAIARSAASARGWGEDQFSCLVKLWNRESGWRVQARNPSSGAYGIPQAYPAEKLAAAGPDWRTSAATQISWGLSYISSRYGSPCGAWDHSESTGWY